MINITLPEWITIKKISARRSCPECRRSFNVADVNQGGGEHYVGVRGWGCCVSAAIIRLPSRNLFCAHNTDMYFSRRRPECCTYCLNVAGGLGETFLITLVEVLMLQQNQLAAHKSSGFCLISLFLALPRYFVRRWMYCLRSPMLLI